MKFFWIDVSDIESFERKKPLIAAALESGANAVIVKGEDVEYVKQLGLIKTCTRYPETNGDVVIFSPNDLQLEEVKEQIDKISEENKEIALEVEIKSPDDQKIIEKNVKFFDYIIARTTDWKIIPLENIVAMAQKGRAKIVTFVNSIEEVDLMFNILERGVDGVAYITDNINEIKKLSKKTIIVKRIELIPAKVVKVKPIGLGDRVCVDTTSMLSIGEGMLIGSQAACLFLIHSETLESLYVSPRPFRVNAGAIHSYILLPDGKTKYLSEIQAGDAVLVTDFKGNAKVAYVGRAKIERRPLILVEAEVNGRRYNVILQNAETICLVSKDGEPISVTRLKVGDEILVHLSKAARHFGMEIEEFIIEK